MDFRCLHPINFLAATAIASIALISVGARQASAADKVQLALLTQPGVWDAGVFAAVDHKFFADEGLEVSFVSPATPADGLKLLASGGVQFATAHSTEVITARSSGSAGRFDRDQPSIRHCRDHGPGQLGTSPISSSSKARRSA